MAPEPGIWGRARTGSGLWPKTQCDFLIITRTAGICWDGPVSAWAKDRSAAPAVNAPGEDSPPSGNRDGGSFCTDANSGAERQPAFSGHAGEAAEFRSEPGLWGQSPGLHPGSAAYQWYCPGQWTADLGFLICKSGIVLTL